MEIDPNMYELIQKLHGFTLGSPSSKSLSQLKPSAKKRSRKQFVTQHELVTKLENLREKREQSQDIYQAQKRRFVI